MNSFLKLIVWILLLGSMSCGKESDIKFHLNSINSDKYYSEEIIPIAFQKIYGKWKLFKISGGYIGTGYEPDYDYLVIKRIGIYGLIRNDSLFEYGKIEVDIFDPSTSKFLQVKFIPDYYIGQQPYWGSFKEYKYIDLKGIDLLDLNSPCCHQYDYHYIRIK